MKPTFEKTVDVLVKAYLNDTLKHGWCNACAVGNLIADAMGKHPKHIEGAWYRKLIDGLDYRIEGYHDPEEADRQIAILGYTHDEIIKIEHAFEGVDYKLPRDERMFLGLMAVVDVLADIHGIDLEKKDAAKLLFVKV